MKASIQRLAGFSFMEILVSLFLFSLILYSFDRLEIYALRQHQQAYFFNIATLQYLNMVERLRALQSSAGLSEQVVEWNRQNHLILPQGQGSVRGYFPTFTVSLYWGKPTAECNRPTSTCLEEKITV